MITTLIRKISLYINTIKFLKLSQIYWRVYYFILSLLDVSNYSENKVHKSLKVPRFQCGIKNRNTFGHNFCFSFLNLEKDFKGKIDWDYQEFGKLWNYNLNYFDFLNQEGIEKIEGELLINDFISKIHENKVGMESYPISLRLINWVKFNVRFSREIGSKEAKSFYNQAIFLSKKLEKHILGNHYLENGFGLLFASYIFQESSLYRLSRKIILNELKEQILDDGLHFELSFMYHKILLYRVLDSINLVESNLWKSDSILLNELKESAIKMLRALDGAMFSNGDIPHVNDSTSGVAPSSKRIFEYSKKLGINYSGSVQLHGSGYRMVRKDKYELFVDVGKVGPEYIPGHAHADTFNFILYYRNKPLIIDVGTSTYDKNNKLRHIERSTRSHNTVTLFDRNSSKVWGGFRVANRANVFSLFESKASIKASHDGYGKNNFHTREWKTETNSLIIIDEVNDKTSIAKAYFHLHGDYRPVQKKNKVVISDEVEILFENCISVNLEKYDLAIGYNRWMESIKLVVGFKGNLKSTINMIN